MHPRVLAERNARAIAEMRTAIKVLAEQEGIDAPDLPMRRGNEEPQVFQLRERESIAAFLGDLAGTRPEPEPALVEDDADDTTQLPVPQTAPGEPETVEEPNQLPAPETDEDEATSTSETAPGEPETVEEPPPGNTRRRG